MKDRAEDRRGPDRPQAEKENGSCADSIGITLDGAEPWGPGLSPGAPDTPGRGRVEAFGYDAAGDSGPEPGPPPISLVAWSGPIRNEITTSKTRVATPSTG